MAKKKDTETEVIESKKRVAADGTQRGLKRAGSKNKATLLLEQMQQDAADLFGIQDYDPVRAMNVVGLMAWQGYPAVDDKGQPIMDSDGNPVIVPPDHGLALAAFAKVAPYVRSQLRPVDSADDNADAGPLDARQKAIELAQALGLDTRKLEGPDG